MRTGRHFRSIIVLAVGCAISALASDYEAVLPPMGGQASDYAVRRSGVEVSASVKIAVTSEGIYRITFEHLTNAGVSSVEVLGEALRLYSRTQELAIYVSNHGLWATNDFLLFYGVGFDGEYSKTNAYWLGWGGGGKRMPEVDASLQSGWPLCTTSVETVSYKREYYYSDLYRPNDSGFNHWFAAELSHLLATNVLFVTPNPSSNGVVQMDMVLYGYTSVEGVAPDHCTRANIGGATVANAYFDGQDVCIFRTNFSSSLLRGTTTVSFVQVLQPSVLTDNAWLKRCDLTYPRNLLANGPQLFFNSTMGSNRYRVAGLTGSTGTLWAFNISDSANVAVLSGLSTTNYGASYACTFELGLGPTGRLAVLDSSAFRACSSIESVRLRNLGDTSRRADYIVVCPEAFRTQVYRVLKRRHLNGLNVAVAPLQDIYNEFGYGIADASAIKQFLGYAFHYWAEPAPKYVLLAGTGTFDPLRRRYPGEERVPVKMGPSFFKWTATDAWYVQVRGTDAVPDLVLGRLSVSNETQMGCILDKCFAFENTPTHDARRQDGLLVADDYDPLNSYDFKASSQAIRTHYSAFNSVFTPPVYLDDASPAVCSNAIKTTVNDGVLVVNYLGHGGVDRWADENIFNSGAALALSNAFYPLCAMVTCQNGAFYGSTDCLVESLMNYSGKGASACLASTGLLSLPAGEVISSGFYDGLLKDRVRYLGDAVEQAYMALAEDMGFQSAELNYFQLFGDPAMEVNPP